MKKLFVLLKFDSRTERRSAIRILKKHGDSVSRGAANLIRRAIRDEVPALGRDSAPALVIDDITLRNINAGKTCIDIEFLRRNMPPLEIAGGGK